MSLMVIVLSTSLAHGADADLFQVSGSVLQGNGTLQGETAPTSEVGFSGGFSITSAQGLATQYFESGLQRQQIASTNKSELFAAWTPKEGIRLETGISSYPSVHTYGIDQTAAALSEVRVQSNFAIYQTKGNTPISFAVIPRVGLPISGSELGVSSSSITGGLIAAVSVEKGAFGGVANLGYSGAKSEDILDHSVGSSADILLGGWWSPNSEYRLGIEADTHQGRNNKATSSHIFAAAWVHPSIQMIAGAGRGLNSEVGAADYRMFAAFGYSARVHDSDEDGIENSVDTCPLDKEDLDGFEDTDGCPEIDNDYDGIIDNMDQCPNIAEDLDDFADIDGCPDNDNDNDGISDSSDSCPNSGASPGSTLGVDGCDSDVLVDGWQIVLKTPFLFGHDSLSGPIDDLIQTLAQNSDITSVRIGVHTDNLMTPDEAAAKTIEQGLLLHSSLVAFGVEPERLFVVGFGSELPIDTNRTSSGQANNRRVELHIISRTTTGVGSGSDDSAPLEESSNRSKSPGLLTVNLPLNSIADVYIDDEKLSQSAPFEKLSLVAGRHIITVTNQSDNLNFTQMIDVSNGAESVVVASTSTENNIWDTGTETKDSPAIEDDLDYLWE